MTPKETAQTLGVMMIWGRERPPLKTTNARTKVFSREIRYRKTTTQQSYDNWPNTPRCDQEKRVVGTKYEANLETMPTWK